jgi:hypothetical protein
VKDANDASKPPPDKDDGTVRKTVSMPKEVFEAGESNAKRRGFKNSFSAYVAWLIERDHEGGVQREK